jgi:ECF sigma factor
VGPTISSLITAAESGDSVATGALFSTLYSELHRLAKRELTRRGAPASLSVTTLSHEAYLFSMKHAAKSGPGRTLTRQAPVQMEEQTDEKRLLTSVVETCRTEQIV